MCSAIFSTRHPQGGECCALLTHCIKSNFSLLYDYPAAGHKVVFISVNRGYVKKMAVSTRQDTVGFISHFLCHGKKNQTLQMITTGIGVYAYTQTVGT
jgi:hypothetical protein